MPKKIPPAPFAGASTEATQNAELRRLVETRYKVLVGRYEEVLRNLTMNTKSDLDVVQYRSGRPYPTLPPPSTHLCQELAEIRAVVNTLAELLGTAARHE